MPGNSLAFDGSNEGNFPVEVINLLVHAGLTSLDISGNAGIVLASGDCPYIEGCSNQGVTCTFPNNFETCIPTMAPTTGSPSYSPVPQPSVSPTLSPVTCEDVNGYSIGKSKRKKICTALSQCEFKRGTCYLVTAEPTMSPVVPTDSPTPSPTLFVPCDDINDYGLRTARKSCKDREDCEWDQQTCSNKTDSPTSSPIVPSEAPTRAPTSCEDYNSLEQGKRRKACNKNDTCAYDKVLKQCSFATPAPTQSPIVITDTPTQSPVTCSDYNTLSQMKRKKACERDSSCAYDKSTKQCTVATNSPTMSPTAPTPFRCESLDNKNECEDASADGCVFFKGNGKKKPNICLTLYDGESIQCDAISSLYTKSDIKKECKKHSECEYDAVGTNREGACVEFLTCDDANNFGNAEKVEKKCLDPEFNLSNDCVYADGVCSNANS